MGYGTDKSYGKNGDYWIIRNSWGDEICFMLMDFITVLSFILTTLITLGTSWGMNGYGYLARNRTLAELHCTLCSRVRDFLNKFHSKLMHPNQPSV